MGGAAGTPEHEPFGSTRRQDIQFLRAFAVVAVLLYHFDFHTFAGGFLGVDIFFVISGYLITRNIVADLRAGTFSALDFYARRFRRLFPASLVTILVTLVASAAILSAPDFRAFGISALHALFSASNFVFWLEAGYFDAQAYAKPLLHTWSLAVEEQFYLIWPVFILALWRLGGRSFIPMVLLVGLVSLLASQLLLASQPDAVFYLMPFRIFEFCAGALLVPLRPRLGQRLAASLFALGCLMMVVSIVFLDGSHPMPGLRSLVPVGGAMLCIVSGGSLRQSIFPRPVTFVGDISYSLYLVHWPIVALFKYQVDPLLNFVEQVALLAASLFLGWLLYRTVEQPMRSPHLWRAPKSLRSPALAFGLTALATIYLAASVWATSGWPWRVPPPIRNAVADVGRLFAERQAFLRERRNLSFKPDANNVLVIGDSHAEDVFNALYLAGNHTVRLLGIGYRCQPVFGDRPIEAGLPTDFVNNAADAQKCIDDFSKLMAAPVIGRASVIVLTARWKPWAVPRLAETIAALRAKSKAPIYVFGSTAEFAPPVPRLVERFGRMDGLNDYALAHERPEPLELNAGLKPLVERAGATYLDKRAILCGAAPTPCPIFVPGTEALTFFDYGHWTLAGANYFGDRLRQAAPQFF